MFYEGSNTSFFFFPFRRFMLKGITMLQHAAVVQYLYTSAIHAISNVSCITGT